MSLLPVDEALSRILAGVTPTPGTEVPIEQAHGRVLSADVTATLTQPPFDASAMDGFAVRKKDVAKLPAALKLIGQSAAGHGFDGTVGPEEAVRIFTGAPVPGGADAIVIQENTSFDAAHVTVRDGKPDPSHIRPKGSDFEIGHALLKAGRKLDARAVTLAAAMGHGALPVRRKPRVSIIATGDELVLPGTPPGRSQIVCSNPFGLAAMVDAAGGEAAFVGIARDNRSDLTQAIEAARDADVLVTIGGASVGDHDLVAPALQAHGMALDFWKIAMRPGKPLLFGHLAGQRVLGFPGNPVSSLVCGRIFLLPLIAKLLGLADAATGGETTAILGADIEANGPRQHYMRAKAIADKNGTPVVVPVHSQDSSLLSPLAEADCLIVCPPNASAASTGSACVILKLDF